MLREFRSFKTRELRTEKTEDGKRYLSGYAANYNVLSEDLGWGMRERIMPGAFQRAVSEDQDVRHLQNHDPNLVLGRTKSKTTVLTEDSKGLKFRTLLPDTSYASDLFESVDRGDIDECSFGFVAVRTAWIEEPDPGDKTKTRCIRELHDVDLFDVSTVTYPAYPGTTTAAERARQLWPDGIPAEVRSRQQKRDDGADDYCSCTCLSCLAGECADCTDADCDDASCADCPMQSAQRAAKKKKTKKVDGEDLGSECFLIVGDENDPKTWKLPWKFSTEEKIKTHLANALARFNQLKDVAEDVKKAAWDKLVKLCKEHGVDVSEESSLRSRLTAEQIYDFEGDGIVALANARLRAIEASL